MNKLTETTEYYTQHLTLHIFGCFFVWDFPFKTLSGIKKRVVHLLGELGFSFFIITPFRKIIIPICSTMPASLQALGRRLRDCKKG